MIVAAKTCLRAHETKKLSVFQGNFAAGIKIIADHQLQKKYLLHRTVLKQTSYYDMALQFESRAE